MCSVTEIEEELVKIEEKLTLKTSDKCMKCEEKPIILVRARDPLCKFCFMQYFVHKFRSTLGKSKAIRQNEKVLLAFSGGPASSCMLELIREGLSENVQKRLRFIPEMIFIDEGAVLSCNSQCRKEIILQVHEHAKSFGFDARVVPLELALASFDLSEENHLQEKELSRTKLLEEKLTEAFGNVRSLTAKQDLLSTLRTRLLLEYAKANKFTKVIVAETLTSLSIKLLSNIAQGKGGSLPLEIGVVDSRDENVSIIRPMRELTLKEVAFFNRLRRIEPLCVTSLDTMANDKASLQRQTEAFVINLQANFPSTVSTIFRTGDKLTLNDDVRNTDYYCVLCKVPITPSPSNNTNYSENCENLIDSSNSECCGKGDGSCSNSKTRMMVTKDIILNRLCYGCRLSFKDMNYDVDLLPAFVIEETQSSMRRSSMRESIQEFLLE